MKIEIYLLKLAPMFNFPYENYLKHFSEARKQKILSYKHDSDRIRTLWAELLTRFAVAKKISRPIEDISIERDANGKPKIAENTLQISISHCKSFCACSLGEISSGIDVEEDFSAAIDVSKAFFAPNEYFLLKKLRGNDFARKFLSLWTLKESFAKFSGVGLSEELLRTDIEQFFAENIIGGRNFYLSEGAVVGICTEKAFLPEKITFAEPKLLLDAYKS